MSYDIQSDISEHARAFQLGSGRQVNVENLYLGDRESFPSALSTTLLGPLVRESDPLDLGVHRASMSSGNAVPAYVPRDSDSELERQLGTIGVAGGIVLLVGDSTAGKSRMAYEAMLRLFPDRRLIAPYNRAEFRYALGAIATSAEMQILWLDNIERFLGDDGLTPRIANHLKYLKTMSIATIRTEEYRRLTRLSASTVAKGSKEHGDLVAAEHVLNHAQTIILQRRWSPAEAARAESETDPRIRAALQYRDTYGIAEYLAAGPMLYEQWQYAWAADANPRGAALVAAAIDCTRAGLLDSIPLELLRNAHQYYLDAVGGPLLRPEPFDEALKWAAQRRLGVTSLLLPGKDADTYRAFDYLTDKVMLADDVTPIPAATWTIVREAAAASGQLHEVAKAAVGQGNGELAESIWRDLADDGDGGACYALGTLYDSTARDEDAEYWLLRAAELGVPHAAVALGHLLGRNDRRKEAEKWYSRAADQGDAHGMYHMGAIHSAKGMEKDAEEWFRRAVAQKDSTASNALGSLLVASGRLSEAEALLREAAANGDESANVYLGIVLADLGRNDEAEEIWLDSAGRGVSAAEANLARLYRNLKRWNDADKWFNIAIDHGAQNMLIAYGEMLTERRQFKKARSILDRALESGDDRVFSFQGVLADRSGDLHGAVRWFRRAHEEKPDDEDVIRDLATSLDNIGKADEAAPLWQTLADAGHAEANYALGRVMLAKGNVAEAVAFFRTAADDGDATAACQLANIYWTRGRMAQAEKWFKHSYDGGHAHAACLLGTFYERKGNLAEAEEYWQRGYHGGHRHLAKELSTLFARQGRSREAAIWLRRVSQQDGGRTSSGVRRRRGKGGRK